jgi:hypothetical protein
VGITAMLNILYTEATEIILIKTQQAPTYLMETALFSRLSIYHNISGIILI